MSIPSMFGVENLRGDYRDVSKTLQGAKSYATRRGIREVYRRDNGGYNLVRVSVNNGFKWTDC